MANAAHFWLSVVPGMQKKEDLYYYYTPPHSSYGRFPPFLRESKKTAQKELLLKNKLENNCEGAFEHFVNLER
jgi:hypothetical protein